MWDTEESEEFLALKARLIACGVRDTDRRGDKRITIEAVVERLEELYAASLSGRV